MLEVCVEMGEGSTHARLWGCTTNFLPKVRFRSPFKVLPKVRSSKDGVFRLNVWVLICKSVKSLSTKLERNLLMQDFSVIHEKINFLSKVCF